MIVKTSPGIWWMKSPPQPGKSPYAPWPGGEPGGTLGEPLGNPWGTWGAKGGCADGGDL